MRAGAGARLAGARRPALRSRAASVLTRTWRGCPACDEAVACDDRADRSAADGARLVATWPPCPCAGAGRRNGLQVAGIAAVVAAFAGLGALVASPSGASPPKTRARLVVAERTDLRGALRDGSRHRLWKLTSRAKEPSPHRRALVP